MLTSELLLRPHLVQKINSTNTWNFALIDYFHDMSLLRGDDGNSINFQKASCTLDGCVKIWTSRVDSVAAETGKLLSGLATNPNGTQNGVMDDDEEEGARSGDEEQEGRKRRRKVSTALMCAPSPREADICAHRSFARAPRWPIRSTRSAPSSSNSSSR